MKNIIRKSFLPFSALCSILAVALTVNCSNEVYAVLGGACRHESSNHYVKIAPTLVTTGSSEYWVCCQCHSSFSDSSMTQRIEGTDYSPSNPSDARFIPALGKGISGNPTNSGTASFEAVPLNAFTGVFEQSGSMAHTFFRSNIDISNYDKVTFAFMSADKWFTIDSWVNVNYEPQRWKLFELVQTSNGVWDIYSSNIGEQLQKKIEGRSGSSIQEVLNLAGEATTYYSTNIRVIKKDQTLTSDVLSPSSVPDYTVVDTYDAPRGYENVTLSNTLYGKPIDNQGNPILVDIDISSYDEVSFAFLTENRKLCGENWVGSPLSLKNWYTFVVTNNHDGTYSSMIYDVSGNPTFGYSNVSSFRQSLLYYNYGGDLGMAWYSTEVRGKTASSPTESVSPSGLYIDNNYKIIYQNNGDKNIAKAAENLFYYLGLSSSWSIYLPPEVESGQSYDPNAKIISIGSTSFYNGSGLSVNSGLGLSGFSIKTKGKSILINAYGTNGFIPSVSYFLEKTINYQVYSVSNSEVKYDKLSQIPLLSFNSSIVPTVGYREIIANPDVVTGGQKLSLGYSCDLNEPYMINAYHSLTNNLLPISSFSSSHPDWYYTKDGESQICYSSHGDASEFALMKEELINEIKQLVINTEGPVHSVSLSISDNWKQCDCSSCAQEIAEFGSYAGQQLHFVSSIADEIDSWLLSEHPDKTLYYVMLSYQQCQIPPANVDYSLNQNVIVQYAPVKADFSKQFSETENASYFEELSGWSRIMKKFGYTNNLWMWVYSQSVECYMLPSNDFEACAGQYKTFAELGVTRIQVEFPYYARSGSFEDLNIYIKGKIMQYADYDYDGLVTDFMDHYYGEASANMKAYYDLLTSTIKNSGVGGSIWDDANVKSYWSSDTITQMISLLDACLSDVASVEDSDRKSVLEDRIHRERCTPIFLLMDHYIKSHLYTKAEMKEYLSEFSTYTAKFGENKVAHDVTTESKISSYKTSINLLLY